MVHKNEGFYSWFETVEQCLKVVTDGTLPARGSLKLYIMSIKNHVGGIKVGGGSMSVHENRR